MRRLVVVLLSLLGAVVTLGSASAAGLIKDVTRENRAKIRMEAYTAALSKGSWALLSAHGTSTVGNTGKLVNALDAWLTNQKNVIRARVGAQGPYGNYAQEIAVGLVNNFGAKNARRLSQALVTQMKVEARRATPPTDSVHSWTIHQLETNAKLVERAARAAR